MPKPKRDDGKTLSLRFQGAAADKRSTGEVTYTLADGSPWLKITTRIKNTGNEPLEPRVADAIRADGEFTFGKQADLGLVWAYDPYWKQAYGTLIEDRAWRFAPRSSSAATDPSCASSVPTAKRRRSRRASHSNSCGICFRPRIPSTRLPWRANYAASSLPRSNYRCAIPTARSPMPTCNGRQRPAKQWHMVAPMPRDNSRPVCPQAATRSQVSALGRGEKTLAVETSRGEPVKVELPPPGYVVAAITDEQGEAIPCKVQFRGRGDTANPNFGPDSAIHGVRNVYYTPDGKFRVALAPGEYDVIVSHGPEFDAVFSDARSQRRKREPAGRAS